MLLQSFIRALIRAHHNFTSCLLILHESSKYAARPAVTTLIQLK
jgi:hypothetical protein